MRKPSVTLLLVVGVFAACSADQAHVFGTGGSASSVASGTSGTGAGGSTSTSPSGSSTSTGQGGSPALKDGGLTAAGVGGAGCVNPGPNEDWDHDGWTIAEGDCNDCDPNVNPGALDTITVGADGGLILGDEDCDGIPGEVQQPCDDNLAVDDPDPMNAAKAVELCHPLTDPKKWGISSATWVLPDGSAPSMLQPVSPGVPLSDLLANYALGHGILSAFGPQVSVQAGKRMLGLSSGTARQPTDPGYQDVSGFDKGYTVNKPKGFIPKSPACPGVTTGQPHDAASLEVVVVAPTNAHGFSFNFDFFTYEWPGYICSEFNDYFLALLYPTPMGHPDGNISFDSMGDPVSVNNAFLSVCGCMPHPPCVAGGKVFSCADGDLSLLGTGFGADTTGDGDHGSTGWLETKAPISPHEQITLRWAVYDSGDGILDTTGLIDNFQWILDSGSPSITTTPVPTVN
jgi:hypothetical protein